MLLVSLVALIAQSDHLGIIIPTIGMHLIHRRTGTEDARAALHLPSLVPSSSVDVDDRRSTLRVGLDLGIVASEGFQPREVSLIHAPGDILAREDGAIKLGDGRVELLARGDEVGQGLEDGQVGANSLGDFLLGATVGHELESRGHVDTVDVGVAGGVVG